MRQRIDLSKLFFIFLFISTSLRFLYALFVMDPFSGPDADTYHVVYQSFAKNGIFSDHERVPFWQPGYPWFLIWLDSFVPGVNLNLLMAFQSISVTAIAWAMKILISNKFSKDVGNIAGILVVLNPALFAASTELMYEVPLIMFLMLTLLIISSCNFADFGNLMKAILSFTLFLSLFFATTIQPKSLLITMLFLIFSPRRSLLLKIFCFMSLIVSVGILFARNVITGVGAGISSNFSTHIRLGSQNVYPRYNDQCPNEAFDTFSQFICLQLNRFSEPKKGIEIMFHNVFDTFAPFVGPYGYGGNSGTGTWFHPFDLRRLFPQDLLFNPFFVAFDRVSSLLWMATYFLIVGWSSVHLYIYNLESRAFVLFLNLALFSNVLLIALGIGDSRYRLGFSFLLIPMFAHFFVNIFHYLRRYWLLHSP